MNEDSNRPQATPPPAATSGLQFDKAEVASEPLLTCAVCKKPIVDEYYQCNGHTVCPTCRDGVAKFGVGKSKGVEFGRAAGAGIGAGFAGFLIYWIVLEITKIHFGLIAIAVGWMVGGAVRWGANRRGGPVYQCLAVVITYVAICSSYIPMVLRGASHPTDEIFSAFLYAMRVPWLEGPSNIIGWIIIGFGLLQAWQMNRQVKFEISGPYFTRQTVPPAAT